MASYSADRTLVQGAKDVGKSMMPVDTKGLDKIITAGKDMAVGALGEIQKREQVKVDAWDAFGKDAEKVMLEGGSLGEVLYGDTVNFAEQAKEDYLAALKSGDKTDQFAAKKAMQDRSLFTQSHKATIQEISKLRNPKEGELGLSKGHSKEQISTMSNIISGRYTIGKNKDDVMVFKLSNGKEVTNAEFESMAMIEHLATGHELGKQVGDVKNSETFNEAASRDSYSRIIPKTEKEYIASMHDDLGGQGGENNFPNLLRQDFENGNLEKEIKSALGQDMYNKFDTDGIPGLSDKEKDNFIDTITNPENKNFDLNTSRTIFVDKMVDATRNAHNTYWDLQQTEKDKDLQDKIDLEDQKIEGRKQLARVKAGLKKKGGKLTLKQQAQKDAEEFWSEISPDHGPQDYIEAFRNITGNLKDNIQHSSSPFTDEQGDVVGSGYYHSMTDDSGKETKQLIAAGTKLPFDAVIPYLDYKQSKAKYD